MFCKRASDKELPVASWLHWHNLTSILLVKIFGQYFPKPVKMMMTWRHRRRHHDFQKFLPNWYPHRPQLLIKATTAALNAFCDLLLHLRLQLKMLLRGTLGTPSHVHTGPRLLNCVLKYVIIKLLKLLLIKSWGGLYLLSGIWDLSSSGLFGWPV